MRRYALWVVCLVAVAAVVAGCNGTAEEYRNRGIQAFETGRIDQARTLLERAVNRDPTDPLTLYYRGRVAEADGFYELAIFYYQSCLEIQPGHTGARMGLADCLRRAGPHARKLLVVPVDASAPAGPASTEPGP